MLIEPRLKDVDGAEGAQLLDEVIAVLRQELPGVVAEEVPGVGPKVKKGSRLAP